MAFVPTANVLMVELRGTLHGIPIENTLYFDRGVAITSGDVEALFDFFEDDFLPAMAGIQTAALFWNEIYATDQTSASAPSYTRVITPAIQGAGTLSPALPGNVSFVISFRTAGRGRSSRGRNYVAGFTEGQVSANIMELFTADTLVAIYGELLGVGTFPPEWTWVVLSRFTGGAPRGTGLPQPVTDVLYTDLTVDTQRGRLH